MKAIHILDNDDCRNCLNVNLFDEKSLLIFRPGSGIGSGSAFVSKPGSGSTYNECGSETLVATLRCAP
jgi:hypothetical protein